MPLSNCRKLWISAALILALTLLAGVPCRAGTIVPPEDRISDARARLLLAELYARDKDTLDEAEAQYRLLLDASPDMAQARVGLAGVLLRQGRYSEADTLLAGVRGNPEAHYISGQVRFAQGDMAGAAKAFQAALDAGMKPDRVRPSLARALAWSGDDRAALPLLEGLAAADSGDVEIALLLAGARLRTGAHGQAALDARTLRDKVGDDPALLVGLADLEAGLGHARAARDLYVQALALSDEPSLRFRAAEAALVWGDYSRTITACRSALKNPGSVLLSERELRLRLGRALLAAQRLAEAEQVLRLALLDQPGDAALTAELARVLEQQGRTGMVPPQAAGAESARVPATSPDQSPADLAELAAARAVQGDYPGAMVLLDRALEADEEYFPARMARLEYLSYSGRHKEAEQGLRDLLRVFPESRKARLALARTLAWDRRYEESLSVYAELLKNDPVDPVPRLEAARVAYWGKLNGQGRELYAGLWESPVDRTLPGDEGDPAIPYDAVEALAGVQAEERAFLEHLAAYRIQKGAWLEARAKELAFDKRFIPAFDTLHELTAFAPGNQEALFDQAQAACVLGLCREEGGAYARLLEQDPLHTLAAQARDRLEIRSSPALRLEASLWEEDGRGELAKMVRFQQAALAELPLDCAWKLTVGQRFWLEQPQEQSTSYSAWGHVLALSGVIDETWRVDGEWTRKYYTSHGLGDYDLGRVRVGANLDGVTLGAGYERTEMPVNDFAVRQKIRSDNLFLDYLAHLTRDLTLSGESRITFHDDGNKGYRAGLELGLDLTDHPRLFKISVGGEFRTTDHDSVFTEVGGRTTDVRHPYWTPRDYFAGTLSFEWVHDLSEDFFCGARDNIYQVRLVLGEDTDDNKSVRLEGEWVWDFDQHWSLHLKGMWHRSDQWNANGVSAGLEYRF